MDKLWSNFEELRIGIFAYEVIGLISSQPLTRKKLDEVLAFSRSNTSSTNMVVVAVVVSVVAICCYANVTVVVVVAVVNAKVNSLQTMNLLLVPFAF